MRKKKLSAFSGAMDKDSDVRLIAEGNYIESRNMLNGSPNVGGAITSIIGNRLASANLYNGDNFCIGTVIDEQGESIISFVWNSFGVHKIIRSFPRTETHIELITNLSLGFQKTNRITGWVVDNLLYWLDGRPDDAGGLSGASPKCLDMNMAHIYNKIHTYKIYVGLPGDNQFAAGATYSFRVRNQISGSTVQTATITSTGAFASNPIGGMTWLAAQMSSFLGTHLTVEVCDCFLKVTMLNSTRFLTVTTSNGDILLIGDNIYTFDHIFISEPMYSLAKKAPACAPVATYVSLPSTQFNNVRDDYFQFRTRIVYKTGEEGPWSEVSAIALNCNGEDGLNAIRVDFSEPLLTDFNFMSIVAYVDVAFRKNNSDTFKLAKRIRACDIGIATQRFIFDNGNVYTEIPSDDTSVGSGSTQVIANHHNVPITAAAMSQIVDVNGNTRLLIGDIIEGYNPIECPVFSVAAADNPEDCLVDITGTVQVVNDPSIAGDNPRFAGRVLNGFVVYLQGTRFFAVSDNPSDGSGTGTYTIRGVPKGKYSLRVASYLCAFDDTNGPRYNLLNGTEWQRTSSPVISIHGSEAVDPGVLDYERVIDLTGFIGTTFNCNTQFGSNIKIQNAHHRTSGTQGTNPLVLVEAYVSDNNGVAIFDDESMYTATPVETAYQVQFYRSVDGVLATTPFKNTQADHNGYAWAMDSRTGTDAGCRIVTTRMSDGPTIASPGCKLFASTLDDNKGWDDIRTNSYTDFSNHGGTLPTVNRLPYGSAVRINHQFVGFVFNSDPAWTTANKSSVSGRIVDANNKPLSGVIVWMSLNNRYVHTNALGEYTIALYAARQNGFRIPSQRIYVTYLADACADYPSVPGSDGTSWAIPTLDADQNTPQTGINFQIPAPGGIICNDRHLKQGGIYKVGIVYLDDYDRHAPVTYFGDVRIPFPTEDDSYLPRTISYSISHIPPIWATKYEIVMTRDGLYQDFRHIALSEVRYVSIPQGSQLPSDVNFGSGQATHILLRVPTYVQDPNLAPELLLFETNEASNYRTKSEDRVRYMLDETLQPFVTGQIIEEKVAGEYIEGEKYYVVIPFRDVGREIKAGSVFEFFTPKLSGVEEEVYYATGVCLPIINPGQSTRRHKGTIQDQTLSPAAPATGTVLAGDVYWYYDTLTAGANSQTFLVEHARKKNAALRAADIGRPYIVDANAARTWNYNRIRVSGIYIPNSGTNALANFGALDFKSTDRNFGPIRWLGMVAESLLAICEQRVQPFYVGRNQILDLNGQTQVGRSSEILNIASESRAIAGTKNPESVVSRDGRAYFWDKDRGMMWQYSQSGLDDISQGMRRYFRTKADERRYVADNADYVIGGYDIENQLYMLTFHPASYFYLDTPRTTPSDTIAFDRKKFSQLGYGWVQHFDYIPDAYASVSAFFATFELGRLYLHNFRTSSVPFCRFYNVQKQPLIRFAVTAQTPDTQAEWQSISVQADKNLYSPDIYIEQRADAARLTSLIPQAAWTRRIGYLDAAIRRDTSDPNFASIVDAQERLAAALNTGRRMVGDHIVIALAPVVNSTNITIFAAETQYVTK